MTFTVMTFIVVTLIVVTPKVMVFIVVTFIVLNFCCYPIDDFYFGDFYSGDLKLQNSQTLISDMKWSSKTKYIVNKTYHRLWILRGLKMHGAGPEDLIDVYQKQVRNVLE